MYGCSAFTRASDERHAEVIELVGLGAQVADDVAQALQTGQLPQAEGDELRPAAHHAESLALLVLSGLRVEFMSGKQVEKLPEDCAMMGHGLDLLSLNDLQQSHSIRQRHHEDF